MFYLTAIIISSEQVEAVKNYLRNETNINIFFPNEMTFQRAIEELKRDLSKPTQAAMLF